jgi:site-specific DNA recombinase
LRSFIKNVEVREEQARILYKLPEIGDTEGEKVLPIDTLGGDGGIRTPYLLTASQTFSRVNYVPEGHNII